MPHLRAGRAHKSWVFEAVGSRTLSRCQQLGHLFFSFFWAGIPLFFFVLVFEWVAHFSFLFFVFLILSLFSEGKRTRKGKIKKIKISHDTFSLFFFSFFWFEASLRCPEFLTLANIQSLDIVQIDKDDGEKDKIYHIVFELELGTSHIVIL